MVLQDMAQLLDSKLKPIVDRLTKIEQGEHVTWSQRVQMEIGTAQQRIEDMARKYISDEIIKAGVRLERQIVVPLEARMKDVVSKVEGLKADSVHVNNVNIEVETTKPNEIVVARLQHRKIWFVSLWLKMKRGVVDAFTYTWNAICGFVRNHPFLVYMASVFGLIVSSVYGAGVALTNIGIISASAWMFSMALDEYRIKSVGGGSDSDAEYEVEEPKRVEEVHPKRAEALMKMAASILFSIVSLGKLIAYMPGLGLSVLVASLVGVGLVTAFSNNAVGSLAARAAAMA